MAIDLKKLPEYVKDKLADKTVGYQFFAVNTAVPVANNGRRIGDEYGRAVRKQDRYLLSRAEYMRYYATGVPMTSTRRLEINSMSKTITAATVMKLLQEKASESLDSSVAKFLPSYWKKGLNVDNLRLGQVLTHRSGLTEHDQDGNMISRLEGLLYGGRGVPPSYYENIKRTIEYGSIGTNKRLYQNVNYGMFRLIIPYMLRRSFWEIRCFGWGLCGTSNVEVSNESKFNSELSAEYVAFVRDHVLGPCGIANADVYRNQPGVPNRSYNLDDSSKGPQSDLVHASAFCGATEWKLSAREYCQFLVGMSNGRFFPASEWQMMLQFNIGLRSWPGNGRLYYGHGGAGAWQRSGWTWVPHPLTPQRGVFMAILTNSKRDDDDLDDLPVFLGKAYDSCS